MRRGFALAAIFTVHCVALAAQGVMVAPHAVFIDHRLRSGSVLLYNPGTEPVEVTISTIFGYPVTDSTGAITLRTVDAPDSTLPSALAWIQAFPRRLTVAPRERQTVRLLARPPAGLADGEYWLRMVIAAQGGRVPISGVTDTTAIQIGLRLEVRTIIGVNYRKGPVATGLALDIVSQITVGQEEYRLFLWNRIDDFHRVARSAEDIALRLHCGRGVDIGDDRHAGMAGAHEANILGRDR